MRVLPVLLPHHGDAGHVLLGLVPQVPGCGGVSDQHCLLALLPESAPLQAHQSGGGEGGEGQGHVGQGVAGRQVQGEPYIQLRILTLSSGLT
jgi:hypothetical protein